MHFDFYQNEKTIYFTPSELKFNDLKKMLFYKNVWFDSPGTFLTNLLSFIMVDLLFGLRGSQQKGYRTGNILLNWQSTLKKVLWSKATYEWWCKLMNGIYNDWFFQFKKAEDLTYFVICKEIFD